MTIEGVKDVQDLHVWSLEGETDVLTVHLMIEHGFEDRVALIKLKIRSRLHVYHIEHSTIETHLPSEEEFDDDDFEIPAKLNRSQFEELSDEYLYLERKMMFGDPDDTDKEKYFELFIVFCG